MIDLFGMSAVCFLVYCKTSGKKTSKVHIVITLHLTESVDFNYDTEISSSLALTYTE